MHGGQGPRFLLGVSGRMKRTDGRRKPLLRRPELVATRVTAAEKAYVKALAKAEGCTITALVYDMVMPVVKERLSQNLGGMEPS